MMPAAPRLNDIGHTNAFDNIARFFGASGADNPFLIAPSMGLGRIGQVTIEPGLQLRYWDVCLSKEIQISKSVCRKDSPRTLNLTYILTPESFGLQSPLLERELRMKASMQLIFDSGDSPLFFTLKPREAAKSLTMTVDIDWLLKAFAGEHPNLQTFLQQLADPALPCLFYEPVPLKLQQVLYDLHSSLSNQSKLQMQHKGIALLLLSDFIMELSRRPSGSSEQKAVLYQDEVKSIESVLRQHLDKPLPSIKDLARQVALSESTLKRYFLLIYGTSIYDYYLQLKMEYAKTLLTEGRHTVKDVAYSLGYEKSSSFIMMFKKFYHLSPGLFRQRQWTP
jgi:AraC-like DNA-binding protein